VLRLRCGSFNDAPICDAVCYHSMPKRCLRGCHTPVCAVTDQRAEALPAIRAALQLHFSPQSSVYVSPPLRQGIEAYGPTLVADWSQLYYTSTHTIGPRGRTFIAPTSARKTPLCVGQESQSRLLQLVVSVDSCRLHAHSWAHWPASMLLYISRFLLHRLQHHFLYCLPGPS
jgi:hypothetical protein